MWNNVYLKPPPINSFPGKSNSIDIVTLNTSLTKLSDEIEKCKKSINIEAALLSRVIYRYKQKFKKHKEMKEMLKIKTSFQKYSQLDLINDIKRFTKSLPIHILVDVYYPTRQMLEYVLVRIQSFSKLMSRIVTTSIELSQLCINRMILGHFFYIGLLLLALSSRIGGLCQHLMETACTCYDSIYPFRNQLEIYGAHWLEPDYKFPDNLRSWLDLTWTREDLQLIEKRRLELPIMVIDDDEDDDVQFCFEYKNDYIIIDDSIKIPEDDIQFVEEYIDLISKMNPHMKNQKRNNNKNVIELDSDIENKEEKEDLAVIMLDDDDIGEKIDRNQISDNNDSDMNCLINLDDENDDINNINDSVIILDTPLATPTISKNKKRGKRKRKNQTEMNIQNKVLECNKNTQNKCGDSSIISVDNSPISITSDSSSYFPASKKLKRDSIIEINSDVSVIGIESLNEQKLDLSCIKTLNDINSFLCNEMESRKKGNSVVSKHLSKKKWNRLVRQVMDVLKERKTLKQSKNVAVDTAKNIIKTYIDCS